MLMKRSQSFSSIWSVVGADDGEGVGECMCILMFLYVFNVLVGVCVCVCVLILIGYGRCGGGIVLMLTVVSLPKLVASNVDKWGECRFHTLSQIKLLGRQ